MQFCVRYRCCSLRIDWTIGKDKSQESKQFLQTKEAKSFIVLGMWYGSACYMRTNVKTRASVFPVSRCFSKYFSEMIRKSVCRRFIVKIFSLPEKESLVKMKEIVAEGKLLTYSPIAWHIPVRRAFPCFLTKSNQWIIQCHFYTRTFHNFNQVFFGNWNYLERYMMIFNYPKLGHEWSLYGVDIWAFKFIIL